MVRSDAKFGISEFSTLTQDLARATLDAPGLSGFGNQIEKLEKSAKSPLHLGREVRLAAPERPEDDVDERRIVRRLATQAVD